MSRPRGAGYAFRPPVVRAALYDCLPHHRRYELHATLTVADPADQGEDSESFAYRRGSLRWRLGQTARAIPSAAAASCTWGPACLRWHTRLLSTTGTRLPPRLPRVNLQLHMTMRRMGRKVAGATCPV